MARTKQARAGGTVEGAAEAQGAQREQQVLPADVLHHEEQLGGGGGGVECTPRCVVPFWLLVLQRKSAGGWYIVLKKLRCLGFAWTLSGLL